MSRRVFTSRLIINSVLRFCGLEERLVCSFANKAINAIYKTIIPSKGDLLVEIQPIMNIIKDSYCHESNWQYYDNYDDKTREKCRIRFEKNLASFLTTKYPKWIPEYTLKLPECFFKSYLYDVEVTADHFNIGLLSRSFPVDLTDKFWNKNHPGLKISEWLPIFERYDGDDGSFVYLLNCAPESKDYNMVFRLYPNGGNATKMLCSFQSFLNNFPVMFKKRSKLLIPQDIHENWDEHRQWIISCNMDEQS